MPMRFVVDASFLDENIGAAHWVNLLNNASRRSGSTTAEDVERASNVDPILLVLSRPTGQDSSISSSPEYVASSFRFKPICVESEALSDVLNFLDLGYLAFKYFGMGLAQRVADALAEFQSNRNSNPNGNGSHSGSGDGRPVHTAQECTYKEFLNCQPLNFKGTKAVVGLTQWFEKMESVFYISRCTVKCQVKTLMKRMTDKYCPRSEIKKLEIELWNLKVKGTDVVSYTQCFQELALMCGRMLHKESDQVEKYVGGLPDIIQGNVMSSKPKKMQEVIEFANDLMDQKIRTFVERQVENKRKLDNNSSDNNCLSRGKM
ncbi:reverse transcriptase domain-containing protein [Tanacetum coccineum]